MTKRWTSIEGQILRDSYETMGCNTPIPGRSKVAIGIRARSLGLKSLHNSTPSAVEYEQSIAKQKIKPLEEYRGSKVPIIHQCLICTHTWSIPPINFTRVRKSGCPVCNKGFGRDVDRKDYPEKATVYLIKVTTQTESFYKIGVTVRSVDSRISELLHKIPNSKIELVLSYIGTGKEILEKEDEVLQANLKHKYVPSFKFSGYTELFSLDVNVSSIEKIITRNRDFNETTMRR